MATPVGQGGTQEGGSGVPLVWIHGRKHERKHNPYVFIFSYPTNPSGSRGSADFTQAAAAAAVAAAAAATATATATATVAAIQEKQNQEMNYGQVRGSGLLGRNNKRYEPQDHVTESVCVIQMGGPAYNNQFIAHSGSRGPGGMASGGMGPGPGPARGPPSMGTMYGSVGGPQRVTQPPNYGPGPQQGHLRPPQGLKRPYNSEVRSLYITM